MPPDSSSRDAALHYRRRTDGLRLNASDAVRRTARPTVGSGFAWIHAPADWAPNAIAR